MPPLFFSFHNLSLHNFIHTYGFSFSLSIECHHAYIQAVFSGAKTWIPPTYKEMRVKKGVPAEDTESENQEWNQQESCPRECGKVVSDINTVESIQQISCLEGQYLARSGSAVRGESSVGNKGAQTTLLTICSIMGSQRGSSIQRVTWDQRMVVSFWKRLNNACQLGGVKFIYKELWKIKRQESSSKLALRPIRDKESSIKFKFTSYRQSACYNNKYACIPLCYSITCCLVVGYLLLDIDVFDQSLSSTFISSLWSIDCLLCARCHANSVSAQSLVFTTSM